MHAEIKVKGRALQVLELKQTMDDRGDLITFLADVVGIQDHPHHSLVIRGRSSISIWGMGSLGPHI